MPAAYMNRQDMCRMRQGIRQNVTMTDLQHSNIPLPPQHPTTHPSPPKSNAIKSSMPSPPNLFKEAWHQQMPRQPRPRRGKPPPYNQPTADNVSLGEQMQHLKQYYEERVVVLVQRCTEAETKLGVLTSERRDIDTQLQHLQALAHSQHDQLQTARQEYASLLDWCREREAHYQRTEHDLAATDTLNQTLVHQVEALNAARQAFEVEWTKQRNTWAQRQEELDASMTHLLQTQAVLRNDILTKDATIQDLLVARDHMESQRLHLKSVNAGLVDQVTKLSHRAVVLEGQVQMEIEFKRSTVAEAEALTQQLHAERRDRQALAMQTQLENQQHRRDFRDRDMACRELTHRCQRMTNDLVVATTRLERRTSVSSKQMSSGYKHSWQMRGPRWKAKMWRWSRPNEI
ncbi:hypothetical protein, variant [Aphanomyces astaci]|uniref:Uncharacterized protein n=1 Tax=Aphanomyces astaci TaxID=112090 RepID=W4GI76_APHAT|nr:hypothetical protein, variant [Aphanomyces astaci]ETV79420.1 hypothetical protein, variant [Aphanomyces astaci]|eukprot:XP_009831261.1 hypothetical protein, variant [Aphanomyces astaci]